MYRKGRPSSPDRMCGTISLTWTSLPWPFRSASANFRGVDAPVSSFPGHAPFCHAPPKPALHRNHPRQTAGRPGRLPNGNPDGGSEPYDATPSDWIGENPGRVLNTLADHSTRPAAKGTKPGEGFPPIPARPPETLRRPPPIPAPPARRPLPSRKGPCTTKRPDANRFSLRKTGA
ncbi:MAG: hypothetical protein RLY31_673 [Bacteroidota bacterium]